MCWLSTSFARVSLRVSNEGVHADRCLRCNAVPFSPPQDRALPATWIEFQQRAAELFPVIFDTKYLTENSSIHPRKKRGKVLPPSPSPFSRAPNSAVAPITSSTFTKLVGFASLTLSMFVVVVVLVLVAGGSITRAQSSATSRVASRAATARRPCA